MENTVFFHIHLCRQVTGLLVGLVMGAGVATAQTGPTEFRGGGFLTDFSAECAPEGWSGTAQLTARVRPAGQPGNPANLDTVSLFFDTFTVHITMPTPILNQYVNATSVVAIGGAASTETTPVLQYRRLPEPSYTVFAPEQMHRLADLNNFSFTPNCRARLNLWLYRN